MPLAARRRPFSCRSRQFLQEVHALRLRIAKIMQYTYSAMPSDRAIHVGFHLPVTGRRPTHAAPISVIIATMHASAHDLSHANPIPSAAANVGCHTLHALARFVLSRFALRFFSLLSSKLGRRLSTHPTAWRPGWQFAPWSGEHPEGLGYACPSPARPHENGRWDRGTALWWRPRVVWADCLFSPRSLFRRVAGASAARPRPRARTFLVSR